MSDENAKYVNGLGRRKEASAQVQIVPGGTGKIEVNGRDMKEYFPLFTLQQSVNAPFVATGTESRFDVSVKVSGGGVKGQADAVRLGIARALIDMNPEYRGSLKKLGYLSRDARVRERKKYGHKGARRSPQWAKR
jgi:small subunit ribosomal protein S9